MIKTTNSRSGEKGFTLVELAIVMIIIGLLIGGILKGQELIANARLASAVSKVKAVDAAMNTFRDSYAGVPGDITNPTTRIASCANRCTQAGNGNGLIGTVEPGAAATNTSENLVAFAQLAAADLLGGVRDSATTQIVEGGITNPSAELPGQLFLASSTTGALVVKTMAAAARPGLYLSIYNGAGATSSAVATTGTGNNMSLTPSQASRFDSKLDDGSPETGSVLTMGTVGAAATKTTAATPGCVDSTHAYLTSYGAAECGLHIRIQQ